MDAKEYVPSNSTHMKLQKRNRNSGCPWFGRAGGGGLDRKREGTFWGNATALYLGRYE